MPRLMSIAFVFAVTALVASLGLTSWWPAGAGSSVPASSRTAATGAWSLRSTENAEAAGAGTGTAVTLRNNMPATVDVITHPDGAQHRMQWGGGDEPLGSGPIRGFTVVYHDPFWPYVYEVTCPAAAEPETIRMSDLWNGRVPEGFALRRGRLVDNVDGVIWFSTPTRGDSTK